MKSFLSNCGKNIAMAFFVIAVAAIGTSQAMIVSLGTTADFAVLDDSAATDADASTFFITGDAGSSSMSLVMAFPYANVNGVLCLATDTATLLAHMIAEYNAVAGVLSDGVVGPVDLGGAFLTPGVHACAATMPEDATMSLINGALANNVFWQIDTLALGGTNAFAGNIVANTSITLKAERGENI